MVYICVYTVRISISVLDPILYHFRETPYHIGAQYPIHHQIRYVAMLWKLKRIQKLFCSTTPEIPEEHRTHEQVIGFRSAQCLNT